MRIRLPDKLDAILALAAIWAAAELILGLSLGGFIQSDRAEALAFLALRPFLLAAAAALVSRWPWRSRAAFYVAAMLGAGLGEALMVLRLGAPHPWAEMLRGLLASLPILIAAELLIQAARRWRPGVGSWIAALVLGILLLVPAVRGPWNAVAMAPGDGPPAARKPRLLLMTSLPVVWGDYGAFDPRSRPSQTYRALQDEFEVQPIDTLDAAGLGSARLLLLAQPRWLAPSELVALDAWVRGGGSAVILADPDLDWPSDLPLGDVRRPLPSSLLGPLLAHWGLALEPRRPAGELRLWIPEKGRKIVMDSPGLFAGSLHARRTIGKGRAILVGDADLMRDDLWAAPGEGGGARHRRLADNPLHLADLLDEAGGISRPRVRAPVAWREPGGGRLAFATFLAFLPSLLLLLGAAGLALLRKLRPQSYPQPCEG